MWGPVLLLDAGLTGQDGMGSLKASKFHWLLTLQHSLITVLSALAHGGPGSCCPPRFGAVADVHGPWQHSPASRAAPDLLFHTSGWGLEAVGLFPAVVPETALAASSPLQTRSRNLPPVSNPVLNRPVPVFHILAPCCCWYSALLPSHPVRHLLSVGCRGTTWVPCVLCCARDMDAAAVGSKPTGSSGGFSAATACFPRAGDKALPPPSSGDPRALAVLCTCQSITEESQGRPGLLPHWDRGWLSAQVLVVEKGHLMAASIPVSGSITSQLPPAPGQGCSTSWHGAVVQGTWLCVVPLGAGERQWLQPQSAASPRASPAQQQP